MPLSEPTSRRAHSAIVVVAAVVVAAAAGALRSPSLAALAYAPLVGLALVSTRAPSARGAVHLFIAAGASLALALVGEIDHVETQLLVVAALALAAVADRRASPLTGAALVLAIAIPAATAVASIARAVLTNGNATNPNDLGVLLASLRVRPDPADGAAFVAVFLAASALTHLRPQSSRAA